MLETPSSSNLLSVKRVSGMVDWPRFFSSEMSATSAKSAHISTWQTEWKLKTSVRSSLNRKGSSLKSTTWATTHGKASKYSTLTLQISKLMPTLTPVSSSEIVVTERWSMWIHTRTLQSRMEYALALKSSVKTILRSSSSTMRPEERTDESSLNLKLTVTNIKK